MIARDQRFRRTALAFGLGAIAAGGVSWASQALVGDGAVDWVEVAVRAVMIGLSAVVIAYSVPPRRVRPIQRAVGAAIYRSRLPEQLDGDLWRAALEHQRSATRVWAAAFPAVLAFAAAVCVLAGVLGAPEGRGLAWGLAPVLLFFAVLTRVFGRRRMETVTDLLRELDERDVRAG